MSNAQRVGSAGFHRGRTVALKTFRAISFDRCIEAFLGDWPRAVGVTNNWLCIALEWIAAHKKTGMSLTNR
jgi:hypothetical protein